MSLALHNFRQFQAACDSKFIPIFLKLLTNRGIVTAISTRKGDVY